MPVSIQPIDIELIDRLTGGTPQERSAEAAIFARAKLAEVQDLNRSQAGRAAEYKIIVDGRVGASEDSVRPGGTIAYEFNLISDVVVWIGEQLKANSPVGRSHDSHPGLYLASHRLFAGGTEIPIDSEVPTVKNYMFVNTLPYARKIEKGLSRQFPDGVYQSVAALARARFGNIAQIEFTYQGLVGLSSGSGTLVNPLSDPTRGATRSRTKGRFTGQGGPKAYNKSDVRFPVINITAR